MKAVEFNITKWTLLSEDKEPKLSKKKRKICKFFGIPIPPRKVFITAEIEHDGVGGKIRMNDAIMLPNNDTYIIVSPPETGNCKIASVSSMWYHTPYIGNAIVVFHTFEEGHI